MRIKWLFITFLAVCIFQNCIAQVDSVFQTLETLQKIPVKYINTIENKIDKYSSRITGKTEKTLAKLSRWENKIKDILDKVSPETSQKLFGNNLTTFSTLLKRMQEGKILVEGYKTRYNEYRDKLSTSIKYLEAMEDSLNRNLVQTIVNTKRKLNRLEEEITKSESLETFIKERKKLLINEAIKYIGKSKYLTKIDKEAYYYIETLHNYKEIFTDKKKAEVLVGKILNKIPAYRNFMEKNSMLASLFYIPGNSSGLVNAQNFLGLQTRASVQALIQNRIASGGPNANEIFKQHIQQGQAQLNQLKEKIINAGGSNSDANIPNFKPNLQKSKTFLQRIQFGSNIQFTKNNTFIPTIADIAMVIGYKLNDKSTIGLGAVYKMGLGNIQKISISHQGIGLRSFIDWKLKKQIIISGGFEMNYLAQIKKISQLQNFNIWQQSGLIGITKKINITTKFFKGTSVQLLYDMLYRTHIPISQPILLRTGYSFN
ncbi:MAG: hypothetical protein KDC15_07455 [Chitinophagaceae bacterium]|nr:hypothetical protein [Chitinophagaceae bacterium]